MVDHADPIDPTRSIFAKDLDNIDHTRETCVKRSRSYRSHPDEHVLDHADPINPPPKRI